MIHINVSEDKLAHIKVFGVDANSISNTLQTLPIILMGKFKYEYFVKLPNVKLLDYIIKSKYPSWKVKYSPLIEQIISAESCKDKVQRGEELLDFTLLRPPYPFQVKGATFLAKMKRVLLCDDVGLGKSVTSIMASYYIATNNHNRLWKQPILVVCPSQLCLKWQRDIKSFTGEDAVIVSNAYLRNKRRVKESRKELYGQKAMFKIVSYDLLRIDKGFTNSLLRPIGVMILDECQYVKSHRTGRFKTVLAHSKHCDYIFGLSATPIEKGAVELFNLFKILNSELFGDRSLFYDRYTIRGFFDQFIGNKNSDELQFQADRYMIRRHKEEVFDEMPEVIEKNYYVELTPAQKKLYVDIKKRALEKFCEYDFEGQLTLESEKIIDTLAKDHPVVLISLLRKVCQSAKLVKESIPDSGKMDVLMDIIESLGESKAVIFCFYRDMVEEISRLLTENNIPNLWVHGGQKENIGEILDKFTPESEYKILVSSDILKEGHDLLAANYIINFDIPLSGIVYTQRCGRVDRIGQVKDKVVFINLIAEDTIESDIYTELMNKMMFFKNIFSPDFCSTRITIQDIRRFLEKK